MTTTMRDFWNSRYIEPQYAYGVEPNEFLVQQSHRLVPGAKALVVGDGEGRNGVWLSLQGAYVTTVDYSESGVQKAKALAAERGISINALCQDLLAWQWPRNAFDMVVSIYLHFGPEERVKMHRAMFDALKPGGVIILEAFNPRQVSYSSGGPRVPEMLYSKQDLANDFVASEIVQLEETVTVLNEGLYHVGEGAVVRLVARKPE